MGIGDGWFRLMHFEMGGAVPTIHVSTYSTYYKTRSTDAPHYAAWYKPQEKPALTDEAFNAEDDFTNRSLYQGRLAPSTAGDSRKMEASRTGLSRKLVQLKAELFTALEATTR